MKRKPVINNVNKDVDDFIKGAKDNGIAEPESRGSEGGKQKKTEDAGYDRLRKNTYEISERYLDAITMMSCFEKMDKSEIVRNALKEYIPAKYVPTSDQR